MADWTYEMLRYAFSWNEESADKALKYVVNSRSGTESMSEFQLLDILLFTILTEKDEVERTSALVFLEEHGSALVFDYTRLHKVYFVLDNILGSPIDGQSMTYSLKSQVLVTYTALLIQFDCFETDVARFEGFVDLLYSVAKHTNKSSDRILRSYACECLHELESWYPGLLFPLLGEDWRVASLGPTVPHTSSIGQNTLGKFVNDELLHIHESYSRLFFTTFQHFTEQIVQEALKHQPQEEKTDALSIAATPLNSTPPSSRPGTPPMTPRTAPPDGTGALGLGLPLGLGLGMRSGSAAASPAASMASMVSMASAAHGHGSGALGSATVPAPGAAAAVQPGQEVFHFRIPERCHAGPEVAFDLAPDQTPPRLPRKLVRTMTRSISLVLETMPTSSSWTKIFFAERLSLFIRVLALPCRVVFHHFSPLLYASRPSLLHAFLVVTSLFSKDIELSVSEAVVERLFALTQDTAVEPCFRLLAINWLMALSAAKSSTFELLSERVQELCPKWHDPLELKEMKLQALLYCFRSSRHVPKNLLVVLESLSEFKYCCRPVGAHAVVFRFLLRILISFAPEMDQLEVPQCLCDLLRSHPRLLPSVLSVERRTNSQAVQYKLLHSLGDFVSRLEPPSRIQCYFGLLVTLSQTPWLNPNYVMTALKRLVFCPSATLTWQVGMRVLITCRRIILSHPQAVIYQPMLRLLHHLATYQGCVDLRDRALLYLRLLTHAGSAALGTVFHPDPADVEQMTQMLTPVLPKTLRLVGGPVPFLRLFKSTDERRKLGILDRQCAVFVLPLLPQAQAQAARARAQVFDGQAVEEQGNGQALDNMVQQGEVVPGPAESAAPAAAAGVAAAAAAVAAAAAATLSAAERGAGAAAEAREAGDGARAAAGPARPGAGGSPAGSKAGSDTNVDVGGFDNSRWELRWGDNGEDQQCPLDWLELAAAGDSEVYESHQQLSGLLQEYRRHVQACPPSIRLPFLLEYREVQKMTSEALDWLDCPKQLFSLELTFSSSEHFVPIKPIRIPFITNAKDNSDGLPSCGFPCMNRLLLRLQPISPVPTSFGVNIAFNDSQGHMYFGQLETFNVAFQDLFLPVRLPVTFWPHVFESLWRGSLEDPCWSVKVLDLDRAVVSALIGSQLGPFVLPSEVSLPEEDFDFEQEEYFERWSVADGDDLGAVPDGEEEVVLHVETVCAMIFIPPCYHLLMRFAISSHSTIVRVLTDRFQLLSYMDSFFMSWSRDGASIAEAHEKSGKGGSHDASTPQHVIPS